MCNAGRRGNGLCQHRLGHCWLFDGKVLLFAALQALKRFTVKVDDLYRGWDELHFCTDFLTAHGNKLGATALADALILRQGDETLLMGKILQDLFHTAFRFLAALMCRHFNDRLWSTGLCLDLCLVEKVDLDFFTHNPLRFLGTGAKGQLLQICNLLLEIAVFVSEIFLLKYKGIYAVLHLLLAYVCHGKPPKLYNLIIPQKSPQSQKWRGLETNRANSFYELEAMGRMNFLNGSGL